MSILNTNQITEISTLLLNKKIGIIPTDTIYGVHCLANDSDLINMVYAIKERPTEKKFITLISNVNQLDSLNLDITDLHKDLMKNKWPGRNTIIFENPEGTTLSFRLPDNTFLQELINITGPLISTSANKHGEPNVKNIEEAEKVFGKEIDFYVDGGNLEGMASSVFIIENKIIKQLR